MSPQDSSHTHLHLDVLMGISNLTCFQLNCSSLLDLAELDHSLSYPAVNGSSIHSNTQAENPVSCPWLLSLFHSPYPNWGRIPPALSNPPSFSPSANSLVKATIISHFSLGYCYHFLAGFLLATLALLHSLLRNLSDQPCCSKNLRVFTMARKASTYDTFPCTVCPPPLLACSPLFSLFQSH